MYYYMESSFLILEDNEGCILINLGKQRILSHNRNYHISAMYGHFLQGKYAKCFFMLK